MGEPAELDDAAAVITDKRPGVLVGNAVYFMCIHQATRRIVEYDMGREEMSVMDLPSMHGRQPGTILVVTEDEKLGFVGVHKSLSLYVWSREAGLERLLILTEPWHGHSGQSLTSTPCSCIFVLAKHMCGGMYLL